MWESRESSAKLNKRWFEQKPFCETKLSEADGIRGLKNKS